MSSKVFLILFVISVIYSVSAVTNVNSKNGDLKVNNPISGKDLKPEETFIRGERDPPPEYYRWDKLLKLSAYRVDMMDFMWFVILVFIWCVVQSHQF